MQRRLPALRLRASPAARLTMPFSARLPSPRPAWWLVSTAWRGGSRGACSSALHRRSTALLGLSLAGAALLPPRPCSPWWPGPRAMGVLTGRRGPSAGKCPAIALQTGAPEWRGTPAACVTSARLRPLGPFRQSRRHAPTGIHSRGLRGRSSAWCLSARLPPGPPAPCTRSRARCGRWPPLSPLSVGRPSSMRRGGPAWLGAPPEARQLLARMCPPGLQAGFATANPCPPQ